MIYILLVLLRIIIKQQQVIRFDISVQVWRRLSVGTLGQLDVTLDHMNNCISVFTISDSLRDSLRNISITSIFMLHMKEEIH